MAKRAALIVVLTALGFSLAGCGPCGFGFSIWDSPLGCRGEPSPQPR